MHDSTFGKWIVGELLFHFNDSKVKNKLM